MSELSITLRWQRPAADASEAFPNAHEITYNEHCKVTADAAPDWGGSALHTNPEQALAAALSSCHMMTFLALAAKIKWPLATYSDHAVAHLGKNSKGQMTVNRIDLHPQITCDDGFNIGDEELEKMHDRAHRYCFIANTLDAGVVVNIHPK